MDYLLVITYKLPSNLKVTSERTSPLSLFKNRFNHQHVTSSPTSSTHTHTHRHTPTHSVMLWRGVFLLFFFIHALLNVWCICLSMGFDPPLAMSCSDLVLWGRQAVFSKRLHSPLPVRASELCHTLNHTQEHKTRWENQAKNTSIVSARCVEDAAEFTGNAVTVFKLMSTECQQRLE